MMALQTQRDHDAKHGYLLQTRADRREVTIEEDVGVEHFIEDNWKKEI